MAPSFTSLRSLIGRKTTTGPHRLCSELGEVHTEGGKSSFEPRDELDIDAWYRRNLPKVTNRQITPTEGEVFVCSLPSEARRSIYPILRAAISNNPTVNTKGSSLVVRQDNVTERLTGLCKLTRLEGSLSRELPRGHDNENHYLTQVYDLHYHGSLGSKPTGMTRKSMKAAYELTSRGTVAYDIPGALAAWTQDGRMYWVPDEAYNETGHPSSNEGSLNQAAESIS